MDNNTLTFSGQYGPISYDAIDYFDLMEFHGDEVAHPLTKTFTAQKSMMRLLSDLPVLNEKGKVDGIPDFINMSTLFDSSMLDKATVRSKHALKRIKDKGYYFSNTRDLVNVTGKTMRGDWVKRFMSFMTFHIRSTKLLNGVVSDEDWYRAIELTVVKKHPDILADETRTFATIIDQDIEDILQNLIFVLCIQSIRYIAMDKGVHKKPAIMPKSDRNKITELEGQIADLEKKLADNARVYELEQKLEKMQKDREKALKENDHKLMSLKRDSEKELSTILSENMRLKEELERLLRAAAAKDSFGEDEDTGSLSPLPETNILFLGGHPNLLRKLQERHPKWSFINPNCFGKPVPATPQVIFYYTQHMSHCLEERVFSAVADETPVVYIGSTNIDKVEQEMLHGYNQIIRKEDIPWKRNRVSEVPSA